MFHRLLLVSRTYSALINVRSSKRMSDIGIKSGDLCSLFYHATSDFNEYVVSEIASRKVRAVTVEVDYDKVGREGYIERKVR